MARRVLLIDDQPLQFELTRTLLREFRTEDYELDWAPTYEQGLDRLLSGDYAACLLDYQLGPRDGLQLLREARASGCRTPIVFLTTEASERINIEALEAGALDYLLKDEITPRALGRSMRYAEKLGETMAALRRLATHDDLTGLPNRREFHRILGEEMSRAAASGTTVAIVLADVDRFKEFNDGHGHPAGDAVLCAVARRIEAEVRVPGRAMRIGGDEFALVLGGAGEAAARETAERAAEAVRREPVAAGEGLRLPATLSAGFAVFPDHASGEGPLVAAADRALYAAKRRGRDRAVGAGDREP